MTILAIAGAETGSVGELSSASTGTSAVTSPIRSGAYAFKVSSGTAIIQLATIGLLYSKCYVYIASADVPVTRAASLFITTTLGGTATGVGISVQVVSSAVTVFGNFNGSTGAAQAFSTNAWHLIECKFNAAGGTFEWKLDGSVVDSVSCTYGSATMSQFKFSGPSTLNTQWDDVVLRDDAYHGASAVLARQPVTGGTPTYDAWLKSSGTDAGALWNETPFGAVNACNSGSVLTAPVQTAVLTAFNTTQTGHGSETIASGDTVNTARILGVGKTSATTQSGANFRFRRRVAAADTDASLTTLTTSDTLLLGPLFAPSFSDINAMQIGIAKDTTGQARTQTLEDIWLMVDYTVASGGTWKTAIGLATASVNTVNGLARASIKTFNGLTP